MTNGSTSGTRDETRLGITPAAYRGWVKLAAALVADAIRKRDKRWIESLQGQLCIDAMGCTPRQREAIMTAFDQLKLPTRVRQKYPYKGRMMGTRQISQETGIDCETLRGRLRRGLSIEEALQEGEGGLP